MTSSVEPARRLRRFSATNACGGQIVSTMHATYAVDARDQVLRLKVSGELTVDGLIQLINVAGADPNYVFGMPVVADYREAHGDWDYSDIQRFRDYLLQLNWPGAVRWAAVVKPGMLVAIGHVLIVISEALNAPVKIRLFEQPASALRWVRGDSPE